MKGEILTVKTFFSGFARITGSFPARFRPIKSSYSAAILPPTRTFSFRASYPQYVYRRPIVSSPSSKASCVSSHGFHPQTTFHLTSSGAKSSYSTNRAQYPRSAKAAAEWTDAQLADFNIRVDHVDAATFFESDSLKLPPSTVSEVILNNVKKPEGPLTKDERQFFQYIDLVHPVPFCPGWPHVVDF